MTTIVGFNKPGSLRQQADEVINKLPDPLKSITKTIKRTLISPTGAKTVWTQKRINAACIALYALYAAIIIISAILLFVPGMPLVHLGGLIIFAFVAKIAGTAAVATAVALPTAFIVVPAAVATLCIRPAEAPADPRKKPCGNDGENPIQAKERTEQEDSEEDYDYGNLDKFKPNKVPVSTIYSGYNTGSTDGSPALQSDMEAL